MSELCFQLAKKFKELIKKSDQLRGAASKDHQSLPLKWKADWYGRFSLVLMQELASFSSIFRAISSSEELAEQAQKG